MDVEVVPGITSALSGAAVLGAPLMHDFCLISLSDLLTPWEQIERRLACAAASDFVICLYNPSSKNGPTTCAGPVRSCCGKKARKRFAAGCATSAGKGSSRKV